MSENVLRVEQVTMQFGGVVAVNDLSLEDRKHRVSTAKGKTADSGKRKEEIE